MNNSQFWTWVDYWECWDFMQDELEDELELEDWADEALWKSARRLYLLGIRPNPHPLREPSAPLPVSLNSQIRLVPAAASNLRSRRR